MGGICYNIFGDIMSNELDVLYEEIVKRDRKAAENFIEYYIDLLKEKNIFDYNAEKELLLKYIKEEDHLTILSIWFYIDKQHGNNDIGIPFKFKLKGDYKKIEDELTIKAESILEEYKVYYKKSKFYNSLKEIILKIFKENDNKMGLTEDELINKYNLSRYKDDVERIIVTLLDNNEITTLEGKNPTYYYFE